VSSIVVALLTAAATVAIIGTVAGSGPVLAGVRTRQRARGLVTGPTPTSPWGTAIGLVGRRVVAWSVRVTGGAARSRRRADRALPALLDQITRQLRSGVSLPVAVRNAAAGAPDEATLRMADELAAGSALVAAVALWRDACPTPARSLVAAALALASEAGGSVASVLDGVSDTLRDRVALDREVAALSSQARASAAVLVVAPIAFAALAATADRRVAEVLLGRPVGWACMAAGAVLDGLGALWMARLVGRSR
jgi:tight adherence protein B